MQRIEINIYERELCLKLVIYKNQKLTFYDNGPGRDASVRFYIED